MNKKTLSRHKLKKRVFANWLPLALPAALFLTPYIWILFFNTQPLDEIPSQTTAERFARTFLDTILYASVSATVAAAIGLTAALLVAGATRLTQRLFFLLFLSIIATPLYVQAVGLIAATRFVPSLDPLLFSFAGAVALQGWALSPFVFFAVYATLSRQPRQWEETALLDASTFQVFYHVRFKLSILPALAGFFIAWVLAFGEFTIPDLLFARDTGRLRTLAAEIQIIVGGYYDFHSARQLALLYLPLPLAAIFALAAILRLLANRRPLENLETDPYHQTTRTKPLFRCFLIIISAIVLAPFAASIYYLLVMWSTSPQALGDIWKSAHDEIVNSLLLCSICAILCVAAGVTVTSLLAAKNQFGSPILFFIICALPFLLPGSLLGFSLLWIFNHSFLFPLRETSIPLAVSYLLIGPALIWPILFLVHTTIPKNLFLLIQLDGGGLFAMIRHVLMPLSWRAWLAAFGLALLIFIGESGATMLVYPPGATPLSARILSVMHYGPGAYVSALCLLSAFFSISIVLFLAILLKSLQRF